MTRSVAVIIPACLQVASLFDKFRDNLCTFTDTHIAEIIIVCNRLSLMSPDSLHMRLATSVRCPLRIMHDIERSVAGAWNRGIEMAMENGHKTYLVTAVDVALDERTVEGLVRFGTDNPGVDIWSSSNHGCAQIDTRGTVDGCDFSCFVIRKSTIDRFGWFDKEYKPAYFEDNDYITRVVVGGGSAKMLLGTKHVHEGSLTIKTDPEMAHHVAHWFHSNEARFLAKWGQKSDDFDMIRTACFKSPFNSGRPVSWWPEQDRAGYSTSGGMHE